MKAVILCGGIGTRLRPITYEIPKALIPVKGKPAIEHIIDLLKREGFNEAVISVGYLKEKIKKNFAVWASLAIVASYVLTFGFRLPDIRAGRNTIHASLLAVLAAFSFGSSTVFSKSLLKRHNFVTATFYRYGFTALIMLVYVMLFSEYKQLALTTNNNWLFMMIIGLTTGSGAIFVYYYGLRRVKAMVATISELLFPVSAIFFDYIVNGSYLSPVQFVAAGVMVFALVKLSS